MNTSGVISIRGLGIGISCLLVVGCSPVQDTPDEYTTSAGTYVIQARSRDLTTRVSKDVGSLHALSQGTLRGVFDESPYRYIGHGYKAGNGIIGDPDNLTYPIVDIGALLSDSRMKDNLNKVSVRSALSEVYAFSDYNEYIEASHSKNKISASFSVPSFLPFRFGFESAFETNFQSRIEWEKKQMMGLVNLYYKESNVKLNATSYAKRQITEKYLSPSFIGSLYNSSIADVIRNYGGYVVCDYAVGGKAAATYLHNYVGDKRSIQSNFTNTLNFSFSWGGKGSHGSSIGFNLSDTSGHETERSVNRSEVYTKVKVTGGNTSLVLNTSLTDLPHAQVDLSSWLSSLVNSDNLVMVDINQNGLHGLDEFVLEENFGKLIRDVNEGLERPRHLSIPYFTIEHVTTLVNGKSRNTVASVLNTRNGDKVIFSSSLRSGSDNFAVEVDRLTHTIGSMFEGIEIKGKPSGRLNPLLRSKHTCVVIPFDIDELHFRTYKNDRNNVRYLYDPDKKVCLSFYDEDYIPEVYGLSELAASLDAKPISMSMLSVFYTVIGL